MVRRATDRPGAYVRGASGRKTGEPQEAGNGTAEQAMKRSAIVAERKQASAGSVRKRAARHRSSGKRDDRTEPRSSLPPPWRLCPRRPPAGSIMRIVATAIADGRPGPAFGTQLASIAKARIWQSSMPDRDSSPTSTDGVRLRGTETSRDRAGTYHRIGALSAPYWRVRECRALRQTAGMRARGWPIQRSGRRAR